MPTEAGPCFTPLRSMSMTPRFAISSWSLWPVEELLARRSLVVQVERRHGLRLCFLEEGQELRQVNGMVAVAVLVASLDVAGGPWGSASWAT